MMVPLSNGTVGSLLVEVQAKVWWVISWECSSTVFSLWTGQEIELAQGHLQLYGFLVLWLSSTHLQICIEATFPISHLHCHQAGWNELSITLISNKVKRLRTGRGHKRIYFISNWLLKESSNMVMKQCFFPERLQLWECPHSIHITLKSH